MDEEDVRAKSAEDAANATEKGIEEIEKTIKYLKNKRENLMQEKLQTCISNYEVPSTGANSLSGALSPKVFVCLFNPRL